MSFKDCSGSNIIRYILNIIIALENAYIHRKISLKLAKNSNKHDEAFHKKRPNKKHQLKVLVNHLGSLCKQKSPWPRPISSTFSVKMKGCELCIILMLPSFIFYQVSYRLFRTLEFFSEKSPAPPNKHNVARVNLKN